MGYNAFTHEIGHIIGGTCCGGSLKSADLFPWHRYFDTPKMLEHGASPIAIAVYCGVTIGFGYVGFRRSCVSMLSAPAKMEAEKPQPVDKQCDARKSLGGRDCES